MGTRMQVCRSQNASEDSTPSGALGHLRPACNSVIYRAKKEWDVEDADEYVNRHLRKARNKKQGERYMQDVPSYFKARRLLEELAFKA
jgi:hypothetical protein